MYGASLVFAGAPLIYVNKAFADLTGFSRNEVLGHNCRFLQGPDTEPELVASIQACIALGQDCHVKITNYKKDGSTFANLLSLRPVKDSNGIMRFVIGLQSEMAVKNGLRDAASEDLSTVDTCNAYIESLATVSVQKLKWQQRMFKHLPRVIHVAHRANAEPIGPVLARVLEKRKALDTDEDAVDDDSLATPVDPMLYALTGKVRTAVRATRCLHLCLFNLTRMPVSTFTIIFSCAHC